MSVSAQPQTASPTVLTEGELDLGMVEVVRLILRGSSIIDWQRLHFQHRAAVHDFLRVNAYAPTDQRDQMRIRRLLRQAAEYLGAELGMPVNESLWAPQELETPFLMASDPDDPLQPTACTLLKVVHTLNHFQAGELRLSLALAEREVFSRVEIRVAEEIRAMHLEGYPIADFEASRKTRESTITKLLSKRRATAAQILDRLRFRVIVDVREGLPLILAEMSRRLIPYNYVVPEETTNQLINFRRWVSRLGHLDEDVASLQHPLDLEAVDPLKPDVNECSADEFRMLNFVVDMPVRVDDVVARPENAHLRHLGNIVFVKVELQMFDQATWRANELNSAASHGAYKERQRRRVRARLTSGFDPTRDDG